jgi:hypothetical protein
MSTFVREIENYLSHGDTMFSMVFTKESITKALNNLKIGKPSGIDDILSPSILFDSKKSKINVSMILEKNLVNIRS